jgi:transposase
MNRCAIPDDQQFAWELAQQSLQKAHNVWPFVRLILELLLHHQKDLSKQEVQTVAQARQLHPDLEQSASLLQSFLQMIRERRGEELDGWLHSAFHSGLPELRSFVVKLRQDKEAVQAGLIFSWSNGAVEGLVQD